MHMRDVTIVYGLTESSPRREDAVAGGRCPGGRRHDRVGIELPGVEVRVCGPQPAGSTPWARWVSCAAGGTTSCAATTRCPEATAQVIDASGWLHSGDLGVKDENGNFGSPAASDMIIRGGENVYPREIEASSPDAADPRRPGGGRDEREVRRGGRRLRHPQGRRDPAPEEVQGLLRGRISRYKVPAHVFFVTEYPMTGSGKIPGSAAPGHRPWSSCARR